METIAEKFEKQWNGDTTDLWVQVREFLLQNDIDDEDLTDFVVEQIEGDL
jgi:hypothetical protein